jgi:hypothetical protein
MEAVKEVIQSMKAGGQTALLVLPGALGFVHRGEHQRVQRGKGRRRLRLRHLDQRLGGLTDDGVEVVLPIGAGSHLGRDVDHLAQERLVAHQAGVVGDVVRRDGVLGELARYRLPPIFSRWPRRCSASVTVNQSIGSRRSKRVSMAS